MHTPLQIDSGRNQLDPLRDLFEAAQRPREQDPDVVARCSEVVVQAATLCALGANSIASADISGMGSLDMSITDVTYRVSPDVSGLITLSTQLLTYKTASGEHVVQPERTSVMLFARKRPMAAPRLMYTVTRDGMHCGPLHEGHAGRHPDLNFFIGVVDKIRKVRLSSTGQAVAGQSRSAAPFVISGGRPTMPITSVPSL